MLHCEFCTEIGQISIHSLVIHTFPYQQRKGLWKVKEIKKCLKDRYLQEMAFHLPKNSSLLRQIFASDVTEKMENLYHQATRKQCSAEGIAEGVWVIHSPLTAWVSLRCKDFPGLLNLLTNSGTLKPKHKY